MSRFENNDPTPEENDQKEQGPEPVIDEEFEKKQKREDSIIKTVIDGILTFFQ